MTAVVTDGPLSCTFLQHLSFAKLSLVLFMTAVNVNFEFLVTATHLQRASILYPDWRAELVLTLAGFGAITSTWRIRNLSRMVKLHLSIWMNIKTLLNYGKRSGRFSC
jgi:hypothetical protein